MKPEDIAQLKSIVADEPYESSHEIFIIDQEIRFHGKLYDITGNETLKKFQKMLLPVFDYVHHSGLLKKTSTLKNTYHIAGLSNSLRPVLQNYYATACETISKTILPDCLIKSRCCMPMLYMPDVIHAALELIEAPGELMTIRTSNNLSRMSF